MPRIDTQTATFQTYNNYYPTAPTKGKAANLTPGKSVPTLDATAKADFSATLDTSGNAITGTSNQITPINNSAGSANQTFFNRYENITRAKAELKAGGAPRATEQAKSASLDISLADVSTTVIAPVAPTPGTPGTPGTPEIGGEDAEILAQGAKLKGDLTSFLEDPAKRIDFSVSVGDRTVAISLTKSDIYGSTTRRGDSSTADYAQNVVNKINSTLQQAGLADVAYAQRGEGGGNAYTLNIDSSKISEDTTLEVRGTQQNLQYLGFLTPSDPANVTHNETLTWAENGDAVITSTAQAYRPATEGTPGTPGTPGEPGKVLLNEFKFTLNGQEFGFDQMQLEGLDGTEDAATIQQAALDTATTTLMSQLQNATFEDPWQQLAAPVLEGNTIKLTTEAKGSLANITFSPGAGDSQQAQAVSGENPYLAAGTLTINGIEINTGRIEVAITSPEQADDTNTINTQIAQQLKDSINSYSDQTTVVAGFNDQGQLLLLSTVTGDQSYITVNSTDSATGFTSGTHMAASIGNATNAAVAAGMTETDAAAAATMLADMSAVDAMVASAASSITSNPAAAIEAQGSVNPQALLIL